MDANSLVGGTAVVTGAGSGFGAAMVDRFITSGMSIMSLDIDEAGAKATATRARAAGAKAAAMRVDVANRQSLEDAAKETAQSFGNCTILCANVGVQQFGAIDRLTDQDWRWVLDVNVMGVIHTVNAFLPLLRKTAGRRHILVTSSSAALSPGIRMGAYTTSKYAVTGYAETLRMELAEEGIGVSILFPAGMITRHLESSVRARPPELGKSEFRHEDIDAMMSSRQMDRSSHVATAAHAARNIMADLDRNERYIITHGEYRDNLLTSQAEILLAHDRAQEN